MSASGSAVALEGKRISVRLRGIAAGGFFEGIVERFHGLFRSLSPEGGFLSCLLYEIPAGVTDKKNRQECPSPLWQLGR